MKPSSSALKSTSRSSSLKHSVSSLPKKRKPPHHLQNSSSKDASSSSLIIKPNTIKSGRTDHSETQHRSNSVNSRVGKSLQAHPSSTKNSVTLVRLPKPPRLKRVDAGLKNPPLRTQGTHTGVHSRSTFLPSVGGAGAGFASRRHHHAPQLSPWDAITKLKHWIQSQLILRTIRKPGCLAQRVQIKIDHEERLAKIRQRCARRVVKRFLVNYVVKRRSLREASSFKGIDEHALPLMKKVFEALLQNSLYARHGDLDLAHQRPSRYKQAIMRIEQAWLRSGTYRTQMQRLRYQLLERIESIERRDLVRQRLSFMIQSHQLFYNSFIMISEGAAWRSYLSNQTSIFDSTGELKSKGIYINEDETLVLMNSLDSSSIQCLLRFLCEDDDESAQGGEPYSEDDIIRECSRRLLFSKEEWKLLKESGKEKLEGMLRNATALKKVQDEIIKCNQVIGSLDSFSGAENPKKAPHPLSMKTRAISFTTCTLPYFLTQRRFFESGRSSNFYGSSGLEVQLNKPLVNDDDSRYVLSDGFILHPANAKRSLLFREYEVALKIAREHCQPVAMTPLDNSFVIKGYSSRITEFYLEPTMSLQGCRLYPQSQVGFYTSNIILGDLWADFLERLQNKQGCFIENSKTRRRTGSEKYSLCAAPRGEEGSEEGKSRGGKWRHNISDEPVRRRRWPIPLYLLFRDDDVAAAPEGSGFFIEDCIDSLKRKTCNYGSRLFSCDQTCTSAKSQLDARKEDYSIKLLNKTDFGEVEFKTNDSQNWLSFLLMVEQLLIQERKHRFKLSQSALTQHRSMLRLLDLQGGGRKSSMVRKEKIA
ncbi:unnamed protein product [Phytomonas sp. Hart1]|nr:unnamed protein product [Phytomonas sp. Hart1]|eukprot:CCW66990.1 unnamed protein product [Phytomonas sp. isolate Hart1]